MDLKRLQVVTIIGPLLFLILIELIGLFVLRPALGENSAVRLVILFAVLTVAVVAFSFWVMRTIQRQHYELESRLQQLAAASELIQRHNLELNAVNSAISSISAAIDLSQVLQNIADVARDLVQGRYAALGVTDASGRIERFITSGISPEEREAIGPLPQGHGLLAVLIRDAKPLRIPDISKDPRSHGFPPNHPPMKSLLGVPILLKGKAIGDLYVTEKIGAAEFSPEDQELLMLLANHAAVAIENARLYEEARSARDRLQRWNVELEATVAERTSEIQRNSKEMARRVFRAQEEERKRIARELHDETAQSLSSMLIALDLMEAHVVEADPACRNSFDRVRSLAKRTLDETRALSHSLRPTILDDFGLAAALQWFADEYTLTFGMPVETNIDPLPVDRLPVDTELALFRIAQEALTNAGKHSEATRTRLSLTFPEGTAKLVIEDNGKGFPVDEVSRPTRQGGLGLYGMKERAELIGADLRIGSIADGGTRVEVTVQLIAREPSELAVARDGAKPK